MGNQQKKKKKKERKKNKKIDNMLNDPNQKKEVKILILGTGESGKSTFVKQIHLIHKDGFDTKTRQRFRVAIHFNLIKNLQDLIEGLPLIRKSVSKPLTEVAENFLQLNPRTNFTSTIIDVVESLWADKSIKKMYERRSLIQIPSSTNYFLDSLHRISKNDYLPNDNDIIMCRIPTTGINQVQFEDQGLQWSLIDVGGQRSERRKWIHHFDNVSIVFYVIALDEYDQALYENIEINRMTESLDLLSQTLGNQIFRKTPCFLVFNKLDLFQKKIKKVDLNVCFKKYKGGKNEEKALNFIYKTFKKSISSKKRTVNCFSSIGTETENVSEVLQQIQESVKRDSPHILSSLNQI
ncbi:guanine nucleotide-binding protein g(o) subunit alpha [Anaeramoeba flamelloides]|uniref:Guanine nucleotide-binding protein g(O) subunit alpha n=1 Tax=Anaeramoeba flamelloides TaxID=1746091 RepID=A0AAV7Z2C6_9EUKA|nr:guanine nucleotide-binding protein g(o) subunit alpha [Anaeramoeba flamelloides]KAJ6238155.1 guanine nucleotide-binding protein g(o) subunit alpha [Anaeramoeba flamelloides]